MLDIMHELCYSHIEVIIMKCYVECPICNKQYKSITKNHLKSAHNISLEEFLEMFPGFDMESEELRYRRSKINKENSQGEEIRRFRSEKAKLQHRSGNLNTSESMKRLWDNPDKRSLIVEKMREAQMRPEVKKRKSELMKIRRADPDFQKKMFSNESVRIAKISEASKRMWESKRDFIIDRMVEAQKDPKLQQRKAELMKLRRRDPEFNRRQREVMVSLFEDEDWVKSLSSSCQRIFHSKWYGDFSVRSSYEEIVCEALEILNIEYEYEKHCFRYEFGGKIHTYRVDYYIPSLDLYIEVKPKVFEDDPVVRAKFNAVLGRGLNIVFADEDSIFDIDKFKNLLLTSTTIPRP